MKSSHVPYRRLKKPPGYLSDGGLEDKLFVIGDAIPVSIVVKEERSVALSPRHFRRVESVEFDSSSQDINPLLAENISQTDHSVVLESCDVLIRDFVSCRQSIVAYLDERRNTWYIALESMAVMSA